MSKTKSSFISSLARSSAGSPPEDQKREAPVAADGTASAPVPAPAPRAETPATRLASPEPAVEPAAPLQARSQGGRPTSLKPGERGVRRNYQMTELDDQALKLYLDASGKERDLSEVVRNALRAYIPPEIYNTAEVMLNFKHSAIGK